MICDQIQSRKRYLQEQIGGRGGEVRLHMTRLMDQFFLLCGHRFQLKFDVSYYS